MELIDKYHSTRTVHGTGHTLSRPQQQQVVLFIFSFSLNTHIYTHSLSLLVFTNMQFSPSTERSAFPPNAEIPFAIVVIGKSFSLWKTETFEWILLIIHIFSFVYKCNIRTVAIFCWGVCCALRSLQQQRLSYSGSDSNSNSNSNRWLSIQGKFSRTIDSNQIFTVLC